MHRPARFVASQHAAQPTNLLHGTEALPSLPSIAPDAFAWIASLRPESIVLGTGHDDRENRHRPICSDRRGVEGNEPLLDVTARDLGYLPSTEPGQELVAEVVPVDFERPRLPCAPVSAKDFFCDRLEQGLVWRKGSPVSARGKHGLRALPGLEKIDPGGIADDLPYPLSLILGVDKETFPPRWVDTDAKSLEIGVTDVTGSRTGPKGLDATFGEK